MVEVVGGQERGGGGLSKKVFDSSPPTIVSSSFGFLKCTIQSLHCTVVWVTRPERPKGVNGEVKQA